MQLPTVRGKVAKNVTISGSTEESGGMSSEPCLQACLTPNQKIEISSSAQASPSDFQFYYRADSPGYANEQQRAKTIKLPLNEQFNDCLNIHEVFA